MTTVNRWHLTLLALAGQPLPPLPPVPAERCHRHVAPAPTGRDDRLQSYARACAAVARLARVATVKALQAFAGRRTCSAINSALRRSLRASGDWQVIFTGPSQGLPARVIRTVHLH